MNTRVIASCGASSSQGRLRWRKTTRFSIDLLDALLEALEQGVALGAHLLQAVFRASLAGEDLFHGAVLDVADLRQVAQPDAPRIGGGVGIELLDRDFRTRILFIEAGFLGGLVTGLGDGDVAGALVPGSGLLGIGQELEEL